MSTQKREDLRLHRAARLQNPKELKYLLETGLRDFRAAGRRNKDRRFAGKTALDIAIEENRFESVKLLLDAGSELGDALFTAACYGSNDVVETLAHLNYDLTIKNEIGENVLHIAMHRCRYETIEKLLDAGMKVATKGPRGRTALHMAAEYGRKNLLKLLLERGSDSLHTIDDDGMTVLHVAVLGYAEVWEDRVGFVQQLLEAGSNVRATDNNGQTALHIASKVHIVEDTPFVDAKIVELLLDAGSDVMARDNKGRIALHDAAFAYDENTEAGIASFDDGDSNEAISLLLKHGSDVNCQDYEGRTALDLASSTGQEEVVRVLCKELDRLRALEAGQNREVQTDSVETSKILEEETTTF